MFSGLLSLCDVGPANTDARAMKSIESKTIRIYAGLADLAGIHTMTHQIRLVDRNNTTKANCVKMQCNRA